MKNLAVLILFVLSIAGVAVTLDAVADPIRVESRFELPVEDGAEQSFENKRRKKKDGGTNEEDEEEVRVANALRVLDLELARARGM